MIYRKDKLKKIIIWFYLIWAGSVIYFTGPNSPNRIYGMEGSKVKRVGPTLQVTPSHHLLEKNNERASMATKTNNQIKWMNEIRTTTKTPTLIDRLNEWRRRMWVVELKRVRIGSVIAGVANTLVVVIGLILLLIALPSCGPQKILPILLVSSAAVLKILIMIKTGIAQQATARTILESPSETILRDQRRVRFLSSSSINRFLFLFWIIK